MRRLVILVCLIALMVPVMAYATERHGTWFDEAIFFEESDQAKILQMMETGEAQFFADPFASENMPAIQDEGLNYKLSYGVFFGYLINVAEFNNGVYNPFHNQKVRVALNNLVDRDYIVDDIMNGLGIPRVTTVEPILPTYSEIFKTARTVEIMASYNEDKAIAQITEGLTEDGCVKGDDGKWYYNGDPVKVIGIIRTEDERKEMGDYLSDQLEKIGFTVDRQYKTSPQATPIWLRSDPADGKWNFYTEGWIMTSIDREQSAAFFYTDAYDLPSKWLFRRAWPDNLDPDVRQACIALMNGDYTTPQERHALLAKAELGTYESGFHVWLVDAAHLWAFPPGVDVTCDVIGGVFGHHWAPWASLWWPRTARKVDAHGAPIAGGTMRIAAPFFLGHQWNPIYGSELNIDREIIYGTEDPPFLPDPFNGLAVPNWAESADVEVAEGLPVRVTNTDWCHLSFGPADGIDVPPDAWADWDAANQQFIPASERFPDGAKAQIKLTVHFNPDLFTWKWHDGSTFSLADCIMAFIMNFDRAKPESAIYDESPVPGFEQFMSTFKGFRIISEDSLVYEVYIDATWAPGISPYFFNLVAETIALYYGGIAWPIYYTESAALWGKTGSHVYTQGPGKWDAVALGIKLESQKLAAFSRKKADTLGVEWMNYVGGRSLQMLNSALIDALSESYIPYEPILGQYVTKDEAFARYLNLSNWSAAHGGILWVGTGPMYVDKVDTEAKIVVCKNFPDHPFPADKWLIYAEPKLGELSVSGPDTVKIGSEATFDISLTHEGAAYPMDEVEGLKWLLIDANSNPVANGVGEMIADGQGLVVLPADQTAKLIEGTSRLEVLAVLSPVARPAMNATSFTAVK